MEDSISIKSNDSNAVSDEFEIVTGGNTAVHPSGTLPQLNITNGGSLEGLWQCLDEMITEDVVDSALSDVDENESKKRPSKIQSQDRQSVSKSLTGKSAIEAGSILGSPEDDVNALNEVQMASPQNTSDDDIEEICDILQDCTIFNGVTYLGTVTVNAPKSETEIQRNMVDLNEQIVEGIKVSVSIPSCSDGSVVMYDGGTNTVMKKYEVCRITFYAHGKPESNEAACFAFTWTHGDSIESSIFQCHVFRCDIPEAVGQVSACFMKAFQKAPKSLTASINGELPNDVELPNNVGVTQMFLLELTMEIKEDDGKGGFCATPRDRDSFKIRSNVEKQICLTVTQLASESQKKLEVKRCFGVLIAPGRHVKHSDMQLLDMVLLGSDKGDSAGFTISGQWNPKDKAFLLLNSETPREEKIPLTVAVDLVVRGITEPVRLLVETHVKVFPKNERFWYFSRKTSLVQPFFLHLKEVPSLDGEPNYEVSTIETSGPIDHNRLNLTLNNLASYIRSPSITSIDTLTPRDEYYSDGDEPLLSGTGEVSKDCSAIELESWSEVLSKWSQNRSSRPRQLPALVRQGIPEALRGEVWQRLAKCDDSSDVMDIYRILITKESNCEAVILRDINRTFTAHEFFKESGGGGQDALFRLSKAYAAHDTEVGYCQGLSYLAATLLLHMPEEQAFCVLLKIMYDYGLRELYKDGFDCLYLRLYQLNRLMEEHLPHLYQHFRDKGVETHMFASQWFLTLYTARFPLYLVFHIIDVFLLQGTETLFQVALALLAMCKRDLMQLDFECILKYFRVTLPKKCRNDEVARNLMKVACSIKMRKLKKYEQEYMAFKEAQESADQFGNELERLKNELMRSDEDKKRLEEQLTQIKDMLKREVQKAESDNQKNSAIISGYKEVCQRLDAEHQAAKASLDQLMIVIKGCERCGTLEQTMNAPPPTAVVVEGSTKENTEAQLLHRITELELELARAKLGQVEAECKNQDLTHKLCSTTAELHVARNQGAWPPWLSKTLSSIKEAAVQKTIIQRQDSAPSDLAKDAQG
ncbi:Kinesin protein [Nesidiocoris tenuis]|uniref:Kinesin protein n=1 Tax=Nesidiocoris tenuis TaxID=355587 RepID=A0ABN7AKT6_9HEMI|nr:Kinesin protein [Nesidiocoris tenuis]